MERREYLEFCRACAMLPQGFYGVRQDVPDRMQVVFDGIVYYPQGYLLEFDGSGRVIHTAILHDLYHNSVTRAPLQKVEKVKKEER